ncbi:hypothetical protein RKE25_00930 [Dyella sp. BiH032]|uniref:hypothetical protein n=1 Tax=Dyella sp. BiH032 TaxID=3075430 RepID=UPI002893727C|nr:hypothetical protein [Dyella sp. BiH032]WNL46227.1 hypothetical protein RKE25_00930 [Dyella sp. BiH032]
MVSPLSAAPLYAYRPIPDDGPPSDSYTTDQAIAKYTADLDAHASPSVLEADRQVLQNAVNAEIGDQILTLGKRDKNEREPTIQQLVDQYGQAIRDRHDREPATTKEALDAAIGNYKTQATTWTPEDRGKVDAYIKQAMDQHPDDIQGAFEQLRDMRWTPSHFYDSNLAIAADYLRARWETQKYNNQVSGIEVEIYLDKKKKGEIPQNGPGPVSQYSKLQEEYMNKGIDDQWNTLNIFEQFFLSDSSTTIGGLAAAAFENDLS